MSGGFVKKHKDELLTAAALAGVGAATGGFGLLAAPEAATGGLLGSGFAGIGGAGEAAGADLLAEGALPMMSGDFAPIAANPLSLTSRLGTGLANFGKAAAVAQLAGLGQQPQQAPPPMMPQGVAPAMPSPVPSMAQTYPVDVIDPEKRRRMMRGMYG